MVCDPDGCPSSHSAPGFGGPVIPSYASGSQWQAVMASQASAGPKHTYKSALSCQYDDKISFLTTLTKPGDPFATTTDPRWLKEKIKI